MPLLQLLATLVADATVEYGALKARAIAATAVCAYSVDDIVRAAIDELRARGRDGLASQLASTRFE